MTYDRRVPLLIHRFHLQNLPTAAGNRIHSEEQLASDVNEPHLPHRAFLRQPNRAWWTVAADCELLCEMALSYGSAVPASTAGFRFQWLNGIRDSPWLPWSVMSGAQDGKSHYESPRSRRRWEGGFGWKSKGGRNRAAKKSPPEGFVHQWSDEQWKGSRAKEGGEPRGNEEIARDGIENSGSLSGIQPKTGARPRQWWARPLAKDAEREKWNS
jgi:hypothetical protein